ncbi:RecB family exonuclease [Chthonomonas calidirosea]|uniref:RecB family exonuclease n=1 Tax=Chthonomonas calidirosea (strain DSM 23976 / ICMP 18418 / T49) TaxID=1303518 RepID=S0EW33_CHTCT|nr:PD-(D/E)XK nuclease family protein [Chthonomonas calidirosea]CCW36068.1 RecB family exonuclease [Chthonomonas calidirosea T49]CEK18429.1 RecB family exonuclease [Chthonomonas calidirosea]
MRTVQTTDGSESAKRKPIFSPTRIATYLECAVKYRYIYLDRIGRFYQRPRASYSFGTTLHLVLRQFHEQGASLTSEELVQSLRQNWVQAGYTDAAEEAQHLAMGEQIVAAYRQEITQRSEPRELFATEKTLSYDMGRYILQGRVDRIDRHPDGTLEIIDYKSGLTTVTPEDVASSLAMCCYQLLVKRLYPQAPVCATIYCLRTGEAATVALSDDALEEFAKDLDRIVEQILQTDFTEVYPKRIPLCDTCDFLLRCTRFWQQSKRREDVCEEEPPPHNAESE